MPEFYMKTGKRYYYPCFTDEVTKAQEITCQNYTAELMVKLSDSQTHAASILQC